MAAKKVVELNEAELAVLALEAFLEVERPNNMAPERILSAMPEEYRETWLRVARAAFTYLQEQIRNAEPLN